MMYIAITLFVVFAFLLMTMNTVYPGNFSGYQFQRGLGSRAGSFNEGFREGAKPKKSKSNFQNKEGFHGLEGAPMENQFNTIVPYLDDARGPQCAGTSNGVTATGGPLCMTEDQQRAFASRGMNSVVNTCKPIVNGQPYVYHGSM